MAVVINNELGTVSISENVIAKIAGAVATKCYGVVGMASRSTKDGLVSLLNIENITRGIKVTAGEGGICVELHIIVEYGVNINVICDSIIHNVSYRVAQATGQEIGAVNVTVESVRVGE